ncbi:MAG: TadE family protein [Ktedonobacterales bacterium]
MVMWHKRRASRGQALVETALFLTILLLMVTGGSDISTLLDDHLNIVYAAREGARVGSIMGANSNADCAILGAVQAALADDRNVTLHDIIIYSADQNGLPISIHQEEEYTGATQCDPTTGQPTIAPIVNNWPASVRTTTAFLEDSLGVELDYSYSFQFNLLGGGSFSGADHAVMPIAVPLYPTPTARLWRVTPTWG